MLTKCNTDFINEVIMAKNNFSVATLKVLYEKYSTFINDNLHFQLKLLKVEDLNKSNQYLYESMLITATIGSINSLRSYGVSIDVVRNLLEQLTN